MGDTKVENKYKTELCRQWVDGERCKYGSRCKFAHGPTQLKEIKKHRKYKSELCVHFHYQLACPYGTRCNYIHRITCGYCAHVAAQDISLLDFGDTRRLEIFQLLTTQ
jgi:hypothetical protein